MAISTEELNFLIYRYLQECGFVHSAFTFSYESLVIKSSIAASRAKDIPPGALVSFIQKGLLYLQASLVLAVLRHISIVRSKNNCMILTQWIAKILILSLSHSPVRTATHWDY
mmetsp:Transcript_19287/g.76803  ORF Transcript_19287/g.76803 Transcript_19287/m.76803 type:complete len:113 (-) Transcript_19287:2442-2780(-)